MADDSLPQFILNFGYGQLNDVSRTNVGPTYNPDTTSGVDSLKNSLETIYSYDTMSGLGALKGICIGITQFYNADSGEGWVSRMFSNSQENPKPLLAIKVRIPFLDSMLPDPFKPQPGQPILDWDVVQLYNTFVAADEEISGDVPNIGDIVRVDYDDRTTRRGGVYLGKVFENPIGVDVGKNSLNYFDAQGNSLQGTRPNATNNYVGAAWVPNEDGQGGGKCKREPAPNTSGATFSLQGFVKGKQYTFQATKVGKWVMDVRAARDFIRMRDAAALDLITLKIVSAFRTMQEQDYFYCKYINENGNAANKPGESNHQSGVALDLNTLGKDGSKSRGTGRNYEWLAKNAKKYGFKRIASEHWHWEHQPSLESIRGRS